MNRDAKRRGRMPAACLVLLCLLSVLRPATAYAAGPAQATLTIKQVFTNTGASAPPSQSFSYRLASKPEGNPMPAGSGAGGYAFAITGTNDMAIGPITFSQAGIYTYEISHTTAPAPGYTYDQEVYKLEISVKSDFTVTVIAYNKNGNKAADITYRHSYNDQQGLLPSDPNAMVDPPVVKTVSGNPATASVFTFQLTAGNLSNPMPIGSANGVKTLRITGSGRGEFGTWSYTREGTYFYKVSEVNTGVDGYTYDDTVYSITDVVKAVNGRLAVTRSVTNDANKQVASLSYINAYTPGGGQIFPQDPGPSPGKPDPGPITGDEFQLASYAVMFCAAGIAALGSACYLIAGRRRRKAAGGGGRA